MNIWPKLIRFTLLAITTISYSQVSVAWTLTDDFESGALGSVVADTSPALSSGGSQSFYSNTEAYSGTKSAEFNISGGSNSGGWGGTSVFGDNGSSRLYEGDELWVRVRTFMPTTFNFTASPRLKFLRYHIKQQNGTHLGYNDIYINNNGSYRYINELNTTAYSVAQEDEEFSSSLKIVKGEWETVIYNIEFGASFSRVRFWKESGGNVTSDGKRIGGSMTLLLDEQRDKAMNNSTDEVIRFLIFTYWNGAGGSPQTQKMYIDDLYISSTEPPPELGFLSPPNPPGSISVSQ